MRFKVENGHLIGGNNYYVCDFEPAPPDYLAQLAADQAAWERKVFSFVRVGAGFNGYFHSTDGAFTEKARLMFTRVEQRGALVEAQLESLELERARSFLKGSLRVVDGTLSLTVIRNVVNQNNRLSTLALHYSGNIIDLTVGTDSVAGEIRGSNQKVEFPLAPQPAEIQAASPATQEAAPAPQTAAVTGEYPKTPGAYVWSGGKWVTLPHNNGHATYGAAVLVNGVLRGSYRRLRRPESAAGRQPARQTGRPVL